MPIRKVDANQKEIVKAFRDKGMSVLVMSSLGKGAPDIAVGAKGMTFFFEIKDGKKPRSATKLTDCESKFFDSWKGHVAIIHSVKEVEEFVEFIKIHGGLYQSSLLDMVESASIL